MQPGDLIVSKSNVEAFYGLLVSDELGYFWDPEDPDAHTWYLGTSPALLLELWDDKIFGTTFSFWRVLTARGVGWCRTSSLRQYAEKTL
jgi:hypothetical protein